MFELNVNIAGFSKIDFERKKVRKTMRKQGREIQKEARRLVSRRVISQAGEYPGKQTGLLQRSIQVRLSRSGFLVRVAPNKIAGMKAFYPAFLFYGTKGLGNIGRAAPGEGVGKSNRRRRGARASIVASRKANNNFDIAPRANYMTDALDARREKSRAAILQCLQDSLIARK